jgi:hypothetical protein
VVRPGLSSFSHRIYRRQAYMDKWLDVTIRITVRDDIKDLDTLVNELVTTLTLHDAEGALVFNPELLGFEEAVS